MLPGASFICPNCTVTAGVRQERTGAAAAAPTFLSVHYRAAEKNRSDDFGKVMVYLPKDIYNDWE